MHHLDALPYIHKLEARAYGWMLDLLDGLRQLTVGVANAKTMIEKGRQIPTSHIAILVDRGADDRAAMLTVVHRIIRAAPEKRNAKRRTRNDHLLLRWLATRRCRKL